MKFILGKKLGMTTIHTAEGAQNVTLIECASKVNLVRSQEKDGYSGVRLEIPKTAKKIWKKEFRTENTELKKGDTLDVSIFSEGEIVCVRGTTKAKGFQGVVKRYNFKGGPASHGGKHNLRQPGAIGSGFPEHVMKGKRMAGRMGGVSSTSKNLKVVLVDKEKNLIGVKGAVPGVAGRVVEVRSV